MTDTHQNDVEPMNSKQAYLLLFLGLFAVYTIIKPAITHVMRQQQQITTLSTQQQTAQQQRQLLTEQRQIMTRSLRNMIEVGELSPHTLPAKVAESTQNTFKAAARLADASTQQLRPSYTDTHRILTEHVLDVTYTINSAKIGVLLSHIANSDPAPRLNMLSLRAQQFGSAKVRNGQILSGHLILSQAALKKNSLTEHKQAEILQAHEATGLNDDAASYTVSLESLFDANLRVRERSPSLAYYRLSAITINPSQRSVLIADKQSGKSSRHIIGDTLAGWRLSQINPQSVTFRKAEESTQLTLE